MPPKGFVILISVTTPIVSAYDISQGERCSALHAACLNGFPEIVKILVDNNADMQEKGGNVK